MDRQQARWTFVAILLALSSACSGDIGRSTATDSENTSESASETGIGTGSESASEIDSESIGDTDTDTDTEIGNESVSESDSDIGSDIGSESVSDTDGGTATETESVTAATDSETTTETDNACFEKDDFTPCHVVTTPDRDYDICIHGYCQSPGCGASRCNPPAPHFPLPDTNQRQCYDGTQVMSCAAPGEQFYGQDAQHGWDVNHAASERFTRDPAWENQPVVTDNLTGLVWQGCADRLSGDDCGTGTVSYLTWNEALVYCDSLTWGGETDWRLPDRYEIQSVVSYGNYFPAIDKTAFPGTTNYGFWSLSDFHSYESQSAWKVDFRTGYFDNSPKEIVGQARCVRSGPFKARHYESLTVSGDRVVRDDVTGLEWQGCTRGLSGDLCETGQANGLPWDAALTYCEGTSWGGHTDWRLPSVVELTSIADDYDSYSRPSIDRTTFPATPQELFWSSSSYVQDLRYAWSINFGWGGGTQSRARYEYCYVRCVRSGPWD